MEHSAFVSSPEASFDARVSSPPPTEHPVADAPRGASGVVVERPPVASGVGDAISPASASVSLADSDPLGLLVPLIIAPPAPTLASPPVPPVPSVTRVVEAGASLVNRFIYFCLFFFLAAGFQLLINRALHATPKWFSNVFYVIVVLVLLSYSMISEWIATIWRSSR